MVCDDLPGMAYSLWKWTVQKISNWLVCPCPGLHNLPLQADSQPVADLSDGLEAAGNQISDLARALQDLKQQLATAQSNLGDLRDSLSSHAADTALHALSGRQPQLGMPAQVAEPGSSSGFALQDGNPGSGALKPQSPAGEAAATVSAQGELPASGSVAAGCMDPSTLQQPQQLLAELVAKVAALEAAVSELSTRAAGPAGAMNQQQQRRVSGEQPASSKLVQALAAQLAELGSHVARLSAQVQAGNSSPAQTQQGSTPDTTADAAGSATTGSLGPAGDAAESAGAPTAADEAAGAAGAAGVVGSGFGAELAAELDGRLSDLEQLVQDLSVIKADQESLQDLRALLADTVTQVRFAVCLGACGPCMCADPNTLGMKCITQISGCSNTSHSNLFSEHAAKC